MLCLVNEEVYFFLWINCTIVLIWWFKMLLLEWIRLMGKVASDKCHKWVFKEPSENEPNISNYWQSSFDAVRSEPNQTKPEEAVHFILFLVFGLWWNLKIFDFEVWSLHKQNVALNLAFCIDDWLPCSYLTLLLLSFFD